MTLWIWNWKSEIPHNTGADVYEDNTKLSNQTKGKDAEGKRQKKHIGAKKYKFAILFCQTTIQREIFDFFVYTNVRFDASAGD